MKTHDELTAAVREAETALALVREALDRHPDTVRTYFDGVPWNALFERVTKVTTAAGWTDSRKNPVEWYGFRFEFDGQPFWVRKGSNWCSGFADCGFDNDERSSSIDPYSHWKPDSPDPVAELLAEGYGPPEAVGVALMVAGGHCEEFAGG